MVEMENEENIKNTIQDTQMLIRNHMQHHKKISKQLHSQIKKDTKTKELFKEKIGKLVVEKERLEAKQQIKSDTKEAQLSTPDIENLRKLIFKEVKEKDNLNEKIQLIQERLLVTKNKMGGLNATQQQQERYEKHIRILENRLDKANQKFNDSVEYDKKLRAEIDKLRKERFFFENILVNNPICVRLVIRYSTESITANTSQTVQNSFKFARKLPFDVAATKQTKASIIADKIPNVITLTER